MNCPNCAAPMAPVAGRDYLACGFCGAFHFPQPLADSPDRITPLGQRLELACPTCADRPLSVGSIEGCRALFCEGCRGVFVTSADFGRIVSERRAGYRGPSGRPAPLNLEDLQRRRDCPLCAGTMDVHPYYGPGNAVIDSCGRCQMIWLDSGELAAIERAPGRR